MNADASIPAEDEQQPMLDFSKLEVWFATGSQRLYGPEILARVE
jgi:hypothetical protein